MNAQAVKVMGDDETNGKTQIIFRLFRHLSSFFLTAYLRQRR
jgi:hypothetical protein